jgi:Nitroreductase family
MLNPEVQQARIPIHNINALFLNRWSPRCMSGEELSDEDLMALFEATRWAPSSYNNQPGGLSTQREIQKAGINSSIY